MDEGIKYYCDTLALPIIVKEYENEAQEAIKGKLSYQGYLYNLLKLQAVSRIENSVNAKIKKAKFPCIKTLEEFNFGFQPKMDEKLIRELCELNFLNTGINIIFVGPPGVGKTHLAIALGILAAKKRKRVMFFTAEELSKNLLSAEFSNRVAEYIESLYRLDLLIIDELGYLELNKAAGALFFKLISKKYENGSIIITTNKPFEEWNEIFGETVLASAILDRLLHHCHPFLINGKSYRMKELFGKENS